MIDLKKFDAVIFDMDGVLIDSEPLWKISMEEVFDSVGCKITRLDFQKTVGLRIDEVVEFWHKERGWSIFSPREVEQKIVLKMVDLIQQNGDPLKGVLETIDFLKGTSLKIGLATSSYDILIRTVLKALNIESAFDFVHSAEHEDYGKPHPAVYLTVAKQLGVKPEKCLVIEDSLNGLISAKAAKMKTICIPEKTHTPEPKLIIADYTFEDMMQFLNDITS